MTGAETQIEGGERLRESLEAIPGVVRAFLDHPGSELYVVVEPGREGLPMDAAVNLALAREGFSPGAVTVRIAVLGVPTEQRRLRYREAILTRPRVGIAAVRVALEWQGALYEGVAEGEGGLPLELRVSARAALRALEAVLSDRIRFQLLGVKSIRIFDHDFVAVLLRSPELPDRRLIGAALSAADLPSATARAVLNATNRMVGNYLSIAD